MASKSLGQLTLDLIARTGGFTGPLDQASRNARQRMGEVESSVGNAAAALTALGAASAVAMGGMALSVIQSAKELEQFTVVANASSAEFQRMAYGAKSAGIEHDKLADIIKDVNDKVGDFAQTGGGAMADFFENIAPKVGVTAEQFKRLSGPEALQLYYRSLEQANLGQEDLIFYMEAIASDATALMPLLKNNGEQFKLMGDEAERLGLVLSDIELEQLTAASQAIDVMQGAMQGATNQLVVGMLPAISDLTEFLQDQDTLDGIASLIGGLDLMVEVGTVAALVFGSRFVSAVTASTISMVAAQVEAIRYQAALARTAGVSATTAAALTTMSAATKGASAAMALVGGPVGAVVLAGSALVYFATRASEAEREADELDRRIRQMGGSFDKFTVAQAERAMKDYSAKLEQASLAMSSAEARVFSLNKRIAEHPGSERVGEWESDLIDARAAVDDARDVVGSLNKDLETLNQLAQGESGEKLATGAREASSAYLELNKQIGQQIIMLSAKTDAERLAAKVAAGYVEGITNSELEQIQALYAARDALEEKQRANEDSAKAATSNAEAERRAAAAVIELVQALVTEANQLGMTNEQIQINELRAKGATAAQLNMAAAAMETVAAFKAQEDYVALVAVLRTEEERLTDQLHERLAVLDAIKGLTDEERNEAAGRIAGAVTEDAPDFGGLSPEVGGAFGELVKIDDAEAELSGWYERQLEMLEEFRAERADLTSTWDAEELALKQQHEGQLAQIEKARQAAQLVAAESTFGDLASIAGTFAGKQSGIYKVMFAAEKAFSIARSIMAIQTGIAQASALPFPANIPAMASVAAATTGIVSTISSVVMPSGMAHDGIDSIPEDGTWLLQKGERVTTAETSDRLDSTLARIEKQQQADAGLGGGSSINIEQNFHIDANAQADPKTLQMFYRVSKQAATEAIVEAKRPGGLLNQ